jgi:hypothetical protein
MNAQQITALALDPSVILTAQGWQADSWQRHFLLSRERQVLLNCCRQAGKSTVVAALALHTALLTPRGVILLVSPSQRQSFELFHKVHRAYEALHRPIPAMADARSQGRLELANGARILALPGTEATIRGFSGVTLLLIDEAAKVPDELYSALRPMLAVSQGRLVCLSTPFGQRGFFWREWVSKGPWQRIGITYRDCPRISEEFVREEERALGQDWVDQEYRCLFTALHGLVYPEFAACLIDDWLQPQGRAVGGIDWGFHNPFAALWGLLDADDVLWIGWERYARQTALHDHMALMEQMAAAQAGCPRPNRVLWYADPSGPVEILECRAAGWKVLKGYNHLRAGIAAVTARLSTGRLKVLRSGCPNLVAESQLYRYPTPQERALSGENPVDDNNHALGALRYLISRLDHKFIARLRRKAPEEPAATPAKDASTDQQSPRGVLGARSEYNPYRDENLWAGF